MVGSPIAPTDIQVSEVSGRNRAVMLTAAVFDRGHCARFHLHTPAAIVCTLLSAFQAAPRHFAAARESGANATGNKHMGRYFFHGYLATLVP
jgi:hypothetical protein